MSAPDTRVHAQLVQRRRAVSVGQVATPELHRTVSTRAETWPGVAKPKPKRDRRLGTANLLSMLVSGSYSIDEEDEEDGCE